MKLYVGSQRDVHLFGAPISSSSRRPILQLNWEFSQTEYGVRCLSHSYQPNGATIHLSIHSVQSIGSIADRLHKVNDRQAAEASHSVSHRIRNFSQYNLFTLSKCGWTFSRDKTRINFFLSAAITWRWSSTTLRRTLMTIRPRSANQCK